MRSSRKLEVCGGQPCVQEQRQFLSEVHRPSSTSFCLVPVENLTFKTRVLGCFGRICKKVKAA